MDYFVNPSCFSAAFAVPVDLCDKYLKLAKGEHIKVLIYMLRNNNEALNEDIIAENLALSVYDVKEALLFWADAGLLLPKEAPKVQKTDKKVYKNIIKPTREDILLRSQDDPKIKWLLNQSQLVFGRSLKQNETQTLVWLYDDCGLDIDLLFIILNHAKSIERLNISFVQSLAIEWLEKGIDTVAAADEELRKWCVQHSVYRRVSPPKRKTNYRRFGLMNGKCRRKCLKRLMTLVWMQLRVFLFRILQRCLKNGTQAAIKLLPKL